MSPRAVTFGFETVNFLLLAGLLSWLFFRPVRDALERQRAAANARFAEADQRHAAAEVRLAELEQQRRELAARADAELDRARSEARAEAKRLLDAAREEARQERERARAELEQQRTGRAHELALDAACAAREMVARLLQSIDGPELETALVGAACVELGALAGLGDLGEVRVEAARPLTPEALARLAGAARVPAAALRASVSQGLLAGVRVSTARGLVDASAAGLAASAERALVARAAAAESGDAA